uniref:Protein kinase domain-containing protein n=2 Tax=Mesocestoides corti TaxID=53468 RepID=A0A5K3FGJ3_MESCO
DSSYHVTLCRVGSCEGSSSCTSRLQVGLQASLHVQQWRICLIGEPSAGCQFIAQWRLDTMDSAYTMESSSGSGTTAYGVGGFDSAGQHLLGFTPPGQTASVAPGPSSVSASYQNDDRFFLEANRSAGKGLAGNYVFQVDGRRLGQLSQSVDELMLRRFPALTAPPGTRVLLPSDGEEAICKSAAIDIRGQRGCSKTAFGAGGSSSLSPPGATGELFTGSSSPHTPPLQNPASAPFATSSLLSRGGDEMLFVNTTHQNPPNQPSSRSKKSSHRQFFTSGVAQTLGRSDAIKIPSRRFTTALSKVTGDNGGGGSRCRSSSKAGSADGSAEGSSSEASLTKPPAHQQQLYFPSVMVGAGIITSLTPGPPPSRTEIFSGPGAVPSVAPPTRAKPKVDLPPPPPPPPLLSQAPPTSPSVTCERCRRLRHHHKVPSTGSSSMAYEGGGECGNGGGVFATDEDVEQQVSDIRLNRLLQAVSVRSPTHELCPRRTHDLYELCKHLYRTIGPTSTAVHRQADSRQLRRCRTPDIVASRRRELARERILAALCGGEGSLLDQLLQQIVPPPASLSCVFLLACAPPGCTTPTDEMDYEWYLVHRASTCCSRRCLWSAPFVSDLNLQDIVCHQRQLLQLRSDADVQQTSALPSGAIPCLVTSGLFVWRFAPTRAFTGTPPHFGAMPQKWSESTSGGSLSRPWSVLYLGPDSECDEVLSPVSPQPPSSSVASARPDCCSVCRSPQLQLHQRARTQQRQHQQQRQQHVYANLIRHTGGFSTLPSISRRGLRHDPRLPASEKKGVVRASARDFPDDHVGRLVCASSSTSHSASQASSPSSPQSHQSYCNLPYSLGPPAVPPNPLKQSFNDERLGTAYANLPHLTPSVSNPSNWPSPQSRWRGPGMASGRTTGRSSASDHVPDEIREPKRNYALVDLRPSPASSVVAPGDTITIISTAEDSVSVDGGRGDSSASTLHTNTSTSSSTIVPGGGGGCSRVESQRRRTSSHSLTAVLPVPTLNYVHIMTSASVGKKDPSVWDSGASSSTASSTTSSSEKEQHAPPPTGESLASRVPYAQIDFERMRALTAINGTDVFASVAASTAAAAAAGNSSHKWGKGAISGCAGLRALNARKKSDGV